MAQNQGGGGQNPGGNQGGGQNQNQQKKQQPSFPKCPQCGTRPLPKDKEACPICCPVYRIDAEATRGEKKWELVVETYENGVEVKVSFAVDIDGKNLFIVKSTETKYWKENGLAVIPLAFSEKDRKAGFRIIGGPAHIHEIVIPGEKPARFKLVKPKRGKGFLGNLMEGLKG